jgi:hypothetical protein
MNPAESKALRQKWEATDMWPATGEQATSVFRADEVAKMFMNFCPETAYDRFGWFATDLYRYTDEIDVDIAHARLGREGADGADPRWAWATIQPMHYTECPLYSLLLRPHTSGGPSGSLQERSAERVLDLRPTFWGMSLDVNALLVRICSWWKQRRAARKRES